MHRLFYIKDLQSTVLDQLRDWGGEQIQAAGSDKEEKQYIHTYNTHIYIYIYMSSSSFPHTTATTQQVLRTHLPYCYSAVTIMEM